MGRRIWSLIIKEFLAVWQDKKSRMVLIVPPLLQLFIFAWAATLDVNNVSIGILNKDEGKWSHELVQRFHGSPIFTHITFFQTEKELAHAIENQSIAMGIHIDQIFSSQLIRGKRANVQLLLDGRRSNSTQIISGYASTILNRLNDDVRAYYGRPQASTVLVPRNMFNPNLIYTWFTVSGLVAVLTALIGVSVTSMTIARERETGTFEQLLVSPLRPLEILIGKAVPAICIGMSEGSIILLAAVTIFHVPFEGSLLLLYVSLFVFICSIVGVGLFVSSLCQTQQQAILGVFVFMAPAIILSGYATPIDNMPLWMQKLTFLNPARYIIFIIRGIMLKGLSAKIILQNIIPMGLIALFTLSAAALLFKKRVD